VPGFPIIDPIDPIPVKNSCLVTIDGQTTSLDCATWFNQIKLTEGQIWQTSDGQGINYGTFPGTGGPEIGSSAKDMEIALSAAGGDTGVSMGLPDSSTGLPIDPGFPPNPPIAIAPGVLTAGNFADGLNLKIFTNFWQKFGFGQDGYSFDGTSLHADLDLNDWQQLLPLSADRNGVDRLDLTIIVDATGSMSDEMEYLKEEIKDIVAQVKQRFPQVAQRYSLVVYRDTGDDYLTKGMQFTGDINKFHQFLSQQFAGGGGDYPESMHVALIESAAALQWDSAATTAKLVFLVADAPTHKNDEQAVLDAVAELRKENVLVYPIAASGVADEAEVMMRTAAVLTGGQYSFLTDDSGVGNPHAEPHFPCFHVEKLNDLMVRLINSELSGERLEPEAGKIIRTIGKPEKGVCLD
jgi:hypothetical protein